MIIAVYKRHYQEYAEKVETLEQAVNFFFDGMDTGDLFPKSIEKEGETIWKQGGPLNVQDSLLELLRKQI